MTSMEESWTDWLCDMEPDDYSLINQSGINVDDGSLPSQNDIAAALQEENPQRSFPRDSHCSCATFNTNSMSNSSAGGSSLERPSKLLKTSCGSNPANTKHLSQKTASSPCGSYILSFDNVNPPPIKLEPEPALKPKTKVVNSKNEPRRVIQESKKKTGSLSRSTSHTPDHILAERMRREKISQQFIALSALIPDLKKMDKASVLGDAIKHVKQLKEQVKVLEEQSKRKSVESVVVVKKSRLSADEDYVSDTSSNSCNNGNLLEQMDKASVLGDAIKHVKQLKEQVKVLEEQSKRKSVESVVVVKKSRLSADEDYVSDTSSNSCNNGNSIDPPKTNLSLPEVEARVSGKNALIRILCEKEKAVLLNIFREIEKLQLSVVNASSLSFGSSVLAITIVAEMEDQFNGSVQKLAKNLRVGLIQFM